MKRKEKTVATNISVPLSLKERMDRHPEINWSATACKAFDRQLHAQEALNQFSEPGLSEEEAIERGLRVQHRAGDGALKTFESRLRELESEVHELRSQQTAKQKLA